jgi:hypothetical protein
LHTAVIEESIDALYGIAHGLSKSLLLEAEADAAMVRRVLLPQTRVRKTAIEPRLTRITAAIGC